MTEVATSRPTAGLSLSAENLLTLDSDAAALDDLVESEVIVGDDSDDEFAFNGDVKDTEEIYVQNGPRGPSLTLGHVTIEHSYCTPEEDDVGVKLVDPDRFSDFFLMEEPVGGDGRQQLQLFSDMRQCVSGGAVSYLQVSPAALSSLQHGPRRLESLTEEDETAAQESPPPPPPPPPHQLRRRPDAAVSAAPAVAASTASQPGDGETTSAAMSVWGASASEPPRGESASVAVTGAVSLVRPAADDAQISGPLSLVGIVLPQPSVSVEDATLMSDWANTSPTEAAGGAQPSPAAAERTASPADADGVYRATVTSVVPEGLDTDLADTSPSDSSEVASVSEAMISDVISPDNGTVAAESGVIGPINSGTHTGAADSAVDTSVRLIGADVDNVNGAILSAQSTAKWRETDDSVAPTIDTAGQATPAAALPAAASNGCVDATIDSVEEGTTAGEEGTAVASVEGTTVTAVEGLATVDAECALSSVSASDSLPVASDGGPDSLPVLRIDESVELRSETSETSDRSTSSRCSPPRPGSDSKCGPSRPGRETRPARAGVRGSTAARSRELPASGSSPATREERRTISNYATLPRNKAKKTPPAEAKELSAVSEIARKPGSKTATTRASPGSKHSALDKNTSGRKRSESGDDDDGSGSGTSTLGRRKKVPIDSAELKRSADKYGTIGRKKKSEPKPIEGLSGSKSATFTAEEMKKSADTFATLGRRKKATAPAKSEPSVKSAAATSGKPSSTALKSASARPAAGARPTAASAKSTTPPAKSSTAPAKPASTRPAAGSAGGARPAVSPKAGTRPGSGGSAAAATATRRPAAGRAPGRAAPARPAAAAGAAKAREKTLICLETACQTVLTGGELSGASLRPRPTACAAEVGCQAELASLREQQQAAQLLQLQAEAEKARAVLDQVQQLQAELEAARRQLTEESADKLEVQEELGRTTSTVQRMMARMEGVEAELQQHQQGLQAAEQRAEAADAAAEQLQHRLDEAQLTIRRLSEDLDKSVAAQKTLLQQVQETEAEARELHEFMQLEKNALVDALRDSENEVGAAQFAADDSHHRTEELEQRCTELTQLADSRAEEMALLKEDLRHLQSRTQDLLLCQGAGLSGASVALSQLAARLEAAVATLLPTPARSPLPHAASVPARLADGSAPSPLAAGHRRTASLVSPLAAPPRSLSQMVRALDLPAGESLADERPPLAGGDSLQELAVRHLLEGRDSPEGEECCHRGERGSGEAVGLDEQVQVVDSLVERLIRAAAPAPASTAAAQTADPPASVPEAAPGPAESELRERLSRLEAENADLRRRAADGPAPAPAPADTRPSPAADNETTSLRTELQRRDRQLEELRQKYHKHKQILTENVQKAESEIQTLDEIIDYVISSLSAVPEVVRRESVLWKLWLDLDGPNKVQTKSKLNGTAPPLSDLNANAADIVKV